MTQQLGPLQILGMIFFALALASLVFKRLCPAVPERKSRLKGFGFWILCLFFAVSVDVALKDSNAVSWAGTAALGALAAYVFIRLRRPVEGTGAIATPALTPTPSPVPQPAKIQPAVSPVLSPLPQRHPLSKEERKQLDKLLDKMDSADHAEEWWKVISAIDQYWAIDPDPQALEFYAMSAIESICLETQTLPALVKAYDKMAASPAMRYFLNDNRALAHFADSASYGLGDEKVITKAQVKKLLSFLDGGHPIALLLAERKPEAVISILAWAIDNLDEDEKVRHDDFATIAEVREELDKLL